LSKQELIHYSERLDWLHHQVYERAAIRYSAVPTGYFRAMASDLTSTFGLRGYFVEGKLMGFVSYFLDQMTMQCQYLGIDYAVMERLPLYQFMLYDLLEVGITKGLKTIEYGRTASEIKAGIGALPVPMAALVKHRNLIKNQLLDLFVLLMHPVAFQERHVFKELG